MPDRASAKPPPRQEVRPAWSAAIDIEDSRLALQSRLIAFTKMMLASFTALMLLLGGMYRAYPEIEPAHNDLIFFGAAMQLAALAAIWRLVLVRDKDLSMAWLNRIDLIYALGIGGAFAGSAALAPDLRPAHYTSLIFACFAVFSRALVVPSTGARTTFVSVAAFVPIVGAAIYLVGVTTEELPAPAFLVGAITVSSVCILLSTVGSRVVYGLRRQVTEAMQLGKYTLGEQIGEGGMGAVYRAHHVLLRRDTAIKLLLPAKVGVDNLDRFEREVQHMSTLTHPNTVAVFDYGRSEGTLYYAMEYLGGGINLGQLVKNFGPQRGGRVASILAQVCGALQEAHDKGFIHRDVTPANIILCERGGMPDVVKVVDFGLVKEITADAGPTTAMVLGTPGYIAPEQVTDPATIGPSWDLYAVGAVGYYLLTGKRVFEGKTAAHVLAQHISNAPKRPAEVAAIHVDGELEAVIMSCLAKAPADRPGSAATLAARLRGLSAAALGDWSEAEARAWWSDYKQLATAAVATAETRSITVDLDHRSRLAR
jgi:serine/threonine-protein kinase|nr:serine/threonine-protein kinase [Kofleriaceae bacterium]